ncbi:Protein FLOWERING LOCUS D [Madurella mycetomatis]|uniref:Protein FLOWERING LOCUS D n=1 Tax=Madurella mycetomatis TaxID=100816 RepID=A0A175WD09_9PEZI|nr:Protein FLOWERING LOCUS D [Madurella mycetomatis]
MEDHAPKRHVCVVGAGISGLRCADILLSRGFQVTILEARERIGGRICQSDELGYAVDIGPNWIHAWTDSEEPHPIYALASDTDTPLHHWNNKQLIYDSSGNPLSDDLADKLSTLVWDIIELAFKFSEEAHIKNKGDDIPSRNSLYDFVKQKAMEMMPEEKERGLLLQVSEMFGAYVGVPIWKQSLRFSWMEECCGGEEMFVESTYSAILQRAAKPALEGATIRLGTLVTSVETNERRTPGQKVVIGTEAGETLTFDEVHHLEVFSPPLPSRLSSAVDSLSLSQLEKVFITFPAVFWNDDPAADAFPCYINWLTPHYAPDTNPEGWPQEIWDLSTFKPPNNHPTILFYLYGDCSRYIVNMVHGKPREEKFRLLDDFFRPYYSRLPGYRTGNANCRPKAILATEWLKDELNGYGSYCNFQIGAEAADRNVLAFREGCPDRRLWFCGEHAAPFEECGTVAGAYLSGEAVGKKIAALYSAEESEDAS